MHRLVIISYITPQTTDRQTDGRNSVAQARPLVRSAKKKNYQTTAKHLSQEARRQSALMSKITNDGLTRSGTGCFIISCTHKATVSVKWLR